MDYQTLVFLMLALVCASISIFISSLLNKTPKSIGLPPGPPQFPIIGNILDFGRNPHKSLTNLSKTYGPIMTLKLGTITTIVISSPRLAKQVLLYNSQFLSNRTLTHALQVIDHPKFSLAWMPPTTQWRTLRKLCATNIFSPQQLDSMQNLRQQKVHELLDYIKERSVVKGEVLDLGNVVFVTSLNSISNTLFSLDLCDFDSKEKSQEFKEIVDGVMVEVARPNIADYFPIFCSIDPQRIHARNESHFKRLIEIFDGIIEERMHSRTSQIDSNKPKVFNDALDAFLNTNEGSCVQLNRLEISHLFLDLFIVGIDTTSLTVEWVMAELLHNSDKLSKARNESHQVIGKDAIVEESHISKLPFLRALIKETMRLHPPLPFLLPFKADEMVEVCGFIVPKNAQVLINAWAIGRDASIWEDPNKFVPERFLECEIDYRGRDFELIPFGAGKRICPGLPLAHRAVHLIVASLIHNYDWKLADGLKPEQMDMNELLSLSIKKAQPLRVHAIPIKT